MEPAFIGVDVGTTSARAGMFMADGTLLATARQPIAIWHEAGDIVEQSSPDIWTACTEAVRAVLKEAGQSLRPSGESVSTPPARWWCSTAAEIPLGPVRQ
jgi:ribulose kinase